MHAVPLTDSLARASGAATDRGGRIEVNPDLTVPGHPEISVIGDVAHVEGPAGKPLPGLATVAIQQAHHVAKAIRSGRPGAETPFRYLDKGALAVVGRGRAVCEIRGLKLWGRPAFFTYLGVHLYYLGGQMGRRLEVLIKWIGARFGERQSALIEGELASVERASPAAEATQWRTELLPLASDLGAARSQMAFTLGFHIILASLGVAFPAIILIANYLGLRRDDADALSLAQRWSKVAAVLFAVGRGDGHGALVRDGPAVARVHESLRGGLRARLRARGDLLLHRGDLHRDLHLRLEAPLGHGRTSGRASRS